MEAQLEDRLDLRFGQFVGGAGLLRLDRLDQQDIGADLLAGPFAGEQFVARFGRAGRAADQLDHLVEVGDGDDQAEQDVGALAGPRQLVLRAGVRTSSRKRTKASMKSRRSAFGAPAADRHMFAGTSLRGVWRTLVEDQGVASRFSSMTMRLLAVDS